MILFLVLTFYVPGMISSAVLHAGMIRAFFWLEYPTMQCPERAQEVERRAKLAFAMCAFCPGTIIPTLLGGFLKHGILLKIPNPTKPN